jgi:hypothetical protein
MVAADELGPVDPSNGTVVLVVVVVEIDVVEVVVDDARCSELPEEQPTRASVGRARTAIHRARMGEP